MRLWFLRVIGGLAVIAASFLVTLYIVDTKNSPATRDAQRVDDIRRTREAIKRYYQARKAYPVDLKLLVEAGYLSSIPVDPLWSATDRKYQYYSNGISNFGLLVWLEQAHDNLPADRPCRTGVGTKESEMWSSNMLECPF